MFAMNFCPKLLNVDWPIKQTYRIIFVKLPHILNKI